MSNTEVELIVAKLRALYPHSSRISLYVQAQSFELQVTQTERLGKSGYDQRLDGSLIPTEPYEGGGQ